MFDDLRGKTAIITGGSRGLGLAMATALARMGTNVALADILPAVHDSATALGIETGVATHAVEVDVTDPDALAEAMNDVATALSGPDILVNSAGISMNVPAIDMAASDWQRIIDVNLTGTFLACQSFARHCRDNARPGVIVNMASMSSRVVNIPQRQSAYNVSKAGVEMLTKAFAIEWLPLNVRVNAIAPGYILSDMTKDFVAENPEMAEFWRSRIPEGDLGRPEDLSGLIVYLASSASRYVVGQTFVIDGGYTLV